jgi:hypothetical protein
MITFETKKGIIKMTLAEFSRWVCLQEALMFIQEKAEQLNISAESMIKPNALDQYIQERFDSVYADVQYEYRLGILK